MSSARFNITARPVVHLGDYARAKNLNFDALALRAGIDPQSLTKPDAEVSCAAFSTLLEDIAEFTNDPQFVLGYVDSMPARPAGVYQTIIFHSETLRDAFRAMSRFLELVTDAFSISMTETDESGSLTFAFSSDAVAQPQFISGQLGIIAVRARQLLGGACKPSLVEFSFPRPPQTDRYSECFGPDVKFDQPVNRITYPTALLRSPLPGANRDLLNQLNGYGVELLHKISKDRMATVRVVQFIAGALQRGEANELMACRTLRIGRRTLQRELAAANTSFRKLLQDERARLARHYLVDTDLSLTSISVLLGYSELSAFSRASKAWFRMSPSQVRASLRGTAQPKQPSAER